MDTVDTRSGGGPACGHEPVDDGPGSGRFRSDCRHDDDRGERRRVVPARPPRWRTSPRRRSRSVSISPVRRTVGRTLQATIEGFLGDHRTAAGALAGRAAAGWRTTVGAVASSWVRLDHELLSASAGGAPNDGRPAQPVPPRRCLRRTSRPSTSSSATVTLAGYRQDVVGGGLAGPAASAPGWLGDDAVAAGPRSRVVLELTRGCQNALLTGGHQAPCPCGGAGADPCRRGPPAGRAGERLRGGLAAARAARWTTSRRRSPTARRCWRSRRRCGRPTRRAGPGTRGCSRSLAADAAATARVLTESSAVVGGRAPSGRHLRGDPHPRRPAARLGRRRTGRPRPRTGGPALQHASGRRRTWTRRLPGWPCSPTGRRSPRRFWSGSGRRGVRALLGTLGRNLLGPVNSLSQVLATAMAAAAGAGSDGALDQVLHAGYVLPSAEDDDAVAAGMGMVLLAGSRGPSGGVPTGTVAEWVRQLLVLERTATGSTASLRPSARRLPVDDPSGSPWASSPSATRSTAARSCWPIPTCGRRRWRTAGVTGGRSRRGDRDGRSGHGLAGDAVVRTGLRSSGRGCPSANPSTGR